MKAEQAFPGARGVDSYPFSSGGKKEQAEALGCSGIEFFIGYLGHMTPERLDWILDAGLAFMPVTKAGEYRDGAQDELAQLKALGLPKGTTVWLDLEGLDAWEMGKSQGGLAKLTGWIETWAAEIVGAGFMAGLYVGAPQPFNSKQLFALRNITRYWLGIGRCVDVNGDDAYPRCGWCMRQDWHNQGTGMMWKDTGVFVDTNAIQADHFGRLPSWVVQ